MLHLQVRQAARETIIGKPLSPIYLRLVHTRLLKMLTKQTPLPWACLTLVMSVKDPNPTTETKNSSNLGAQKTKSCSLLRPKRPGLAFLLQTVAVPQSDNLQTVFHPDSNNNNCSLKNTRMIRTMRSLVSLRLITSTRIWTTPSEAKPQVVAVVEVVVFRTPLHKRVEKLPHQVIMEVALHKLISMMSWLQ